MATAEIVSTAEAKKLRKYLTTLTENVMQYLDAIDLLMKEPESVRRGQKIARLTNALEMANDSARYFGLGIDYRTDKKADR